jgi:subtilisin family serine protease
MGNGKSNFFKLVVVATAMILSAVSCQRKMNSTGMLGEALMSDRSQIKDGMQVVLVELKTDALGVTAQRDDQGQLQIDSDQKAQIDKEQTDAEAKLKALSSDIRVMFRYHYVLNAIAVVAPMQMADQIGKLPFVRSALIHQIFTLPKLAANKQLSDEVNKAIFNKEHTSVTFLQAQAAYDQGIKGQGVKVGVIDTGLDYTHSMLGGSGKVEDYKSVDPNKPNSFFPNKKVLGGIDLVGTVYDSASLDPAKRIPIPDENPMDELGHGSHVGGTIAGIGDGINSYDGVAPEASLFAIKVFGAGSTSDEVVIAALEWAADPNQDGQFGDQMDVVNLSLGGQNGSAYELYNKAVANLTKMGTVVVASAGNEGNIPFIVGSPSTADEALSVAAQIDDSDHNWRFKTIGFFEDGKSIGKAEAIEGSSSKPIADLDDAHAQGSLVYAGLADHDYSDDEAKAIQGHVVLIDRGTVTFEQKISRAQKSGAIGVIVAQNRADDPFVMGADTKFEIPAVMISQDLGKTIKAELDKGSVVTVNFKNPDIIEKPQLIAQITDFSSRGPRSYDLLIKPEITGPGLNVISASLGEGTKTVQMSGTSMSGPHVTGVMALMKQKYKKLSVRELKSVVMSTATQIKTDKGVSESVARQGAGQANVARAIQAQFVSEPSAFSLGFQQVEKQKQLSTSLRLKSLSDDDVQLKISLETSSAAVALAGQTVTVKPQGVTDVSLNWTLSSSALAGLEDEVTGWVVLTNGQWVQRIPFLVRIQKISNIHLTQSQMGSTSQLDAEGSTASLEFTNKGLFAGDIWGFNLISTDEQKKAGDSDLESTQCDIKDIGYRINQDQLEIAVKFYRRVSSWGICEVSVMFDKDGDHKADAELALTMISRIPGLTGTDIKSTLLDYKKAQDIVKQTEEQAKTALKKPELSLAPAVLAQEDAVAGDMRSAVILKVALADLKSAVGVEPLIQVISTANESRNVQSDDFVKGEKKWFKLSLAPEDQSWIGLNNWTLQGGQTQKVSLTRGAALNSMLIVYPNNSLDTRGLNDGQSQIFQPKYQ